MEEGLLYGLLFEHPPNAKTIVLLGFGVENDLRKNFYFRNNWHHFVSLFLSSKKARGFHQPEAGLVKWYNGSFVMISWEFDPLIQHHTYATTKKKKESMNGGKK